MRTLLLVCFAGTLLAQPSKSPSSREQEVRADKQQPIPQNNPPKLAETPLTAAAAEQPPAKANTSKGNNQGENSWRKYLREAFGPAYLSNWTLALFALVAAGIALKTLNAIKEQARIARIGLNVTRIAANAARASANAATSSAQTAGIQAATMERQSVATEEAVKIAKESAEAATLSANTAKRALELTERAEVQIQQVTASGGPAPPTASTVVSVMIRNYGRTRAIGITPTGLLKIGPGTEATAFLENIPFDLAPQAEMLLTFPPLGTWMSEDSITSLKRNDAFLWFETKIAYKDVFGGDHLTEADGTRDYRGAWSLTRNTST